MSRNSVKSKVETIRPNCPDCEREGTAIEVVGDFPHGYRVTKGQGWKCPSGCGGYWFGEGEHILED